MYRELGWQIFGKCKQRNQQEPDGLYARIYIMYVSTLKLTAPWNIKNVFSKI